MVSNSGPRMTLPTQLVLRVMLEESDQEMYGLQISQAAGLPSGTIHPILARLEGFGWVESRWEGIDPTKEGRPRRRYYRFTRAGAGQAAMALQRVHIPAALVSRLRPGLLGGATT